VLVGVKEVLGSGKEVSSEGGGGGGGVGGKIKFIVGGWV
jgi:hypothetical protein